MDAALDEIAVDPMFMSSAERKAALICSAKVRARSEAAIQLRLGRCAAHRSSPTRWTGAGGWSMPLERLFDGHLRRPVRRSPR
jgi:hypothetical protein